MRTILTENRLESTSDAAQRSSRREAISEDESVPEAPKALPTSGPNPASRTTDQTGQITLWLRRADQWLLGFLLIALLVLLMAFRWKLSGGGRTEIEIVSQQPREYFYAIDVNNASWVEWAQLDGIGEKLARRIVKDREDRGPFNSIDDIHRVRGFGPKLVEKLRPFLKCANKERERPVDQTDIVKEPR